MDVNNKASAPNPFVAEVTNEDFQDSLAEFVRNRYQEAYEHKVSSGVQTHLMRNLRVKKGDYQPDERAMVGEIDVYIAISALKSRAAESWLLDVLMNSAEKPWALKPTPIPTLPDDLKEQAITMMAGELDQFQTMDEVRQRAQDLKKLLLEHATQVATEATTSMGTLIEDQLDEGGWDTTFSQFLSDLCTYPASLLRGPVVIRKTQATYKGNAVTAESVDVPTVRHISPWDAFPSPTSTTTQDGDYFIERVRYSPAKLYPLKNVDSFDETNVRMAMEAYPNGYQLQQNSDAERDRLENKDQSIRQRYNLLDVIIYNGVLPGKFLIEKGVLVEDPQKQYEAEVWVLGEYTLRAVLNPHPAGARPIHGTSFSKINGSFWGDDPISLTYDIQRVCNSAVRSMVRNMAYSSGPIAEVVAERMASGESVDQIDPYRMYFVTPDLTGSGQRAINFNKVPDVSGPLMSVLDRFMKLADDISGIPAYVVGNPQVAGAGRTLGGLSMLMGNAAKGIKAVMLNIDKDVIAGTVRSFYMYNLITSEDASIKADAQVVAQGTSGLLQRELQQNKLTEVLQLLTPYTQMSGVVLPTAVMYLLRQILTDAGVDADKIIPNPEQVEKQQAQAREEAMKQAAGPAAPSSPGRAPPNAMGAQGAISASALPPSPQAESIPQPPQQAPQQAPQQPIPKPVPQAPVGA